MKMCFDIRLGAAAAAVLLLLTGCGQPKAPDPPLAQTELMNRLLGALQAHRTGEALNLTEKLQALDPDNIVFSELRNRLIGNLYAQKCTELLQSRGVDAALEEVRRGRGQYPAHLRLRTIEQQLIRLKTLERAAAALRDAKDVQALSAALAAVAPLVKPYPEAQQLREDIAARRKDLMKMREEARKKAEEEARKKAEEEARKKAEEEAKRKAEAEVREKAEEEAARLKREAEAGPLPSENGVPAPVVSDTRPAAPAAEPSGGSGQ